MLPQSGHRGLSIAFRCPIVVFPWGLACWGPRLGSRHLVDSNFVFVFVWRCYLKKWCNNPTLDS